MLEQQPIHSVWQLDSGAAEPSAARAWYCVRTQMKREHIAAAHLRLIEQVEVFSPRIRYKAGTTLGPVWRTEALFPGYVFARFSLAEMSRRIRAAQGVSTIVHFGLHCPSIPEIAMLELQSGLGGSEEGRVEDEFASGAEVRVSGGVFHGLRAVVTRVLPARQRVEILLEFLGRQVAAEVETGALVFDAPHGLVLGVP